MFDYDNDGLVDVFVASATTFDRAPGAEPTSHLYRNLGQLRFEDVTARSGLDSAGWSQGVCVGDVDNDGHRDLFVTRYGESRLYRNQGGTFVDVSRTAGVLPARPRWDTGCTFVDYDRDGRLDLAVTSYLEFDRSKVPAPGASGYCQWKGMPVMCGPRGLPFARHRLLRNTGSGTLRRHVRVERDRKGHGLLRLHDHRGRCQRRWLPGSVRRVRFHAQPSVLNRHDGTFEESGLLAGVALNDDGQEQGGMGVAMADYDEDGHVDIVKTNFSDDVPNLYRNRGDGTFEDRVFQSGLGAFMQFVGWGVQFLDVDHDSRKDLLLVNGHVYPEAARLPGVQYRQPRLLYWNVGGRFKDITAEAGPALAEAWSSRGSAAGDLDNDGSLEVVINNMGARPSLLKNFGPRKNWLLVRAVGTRSNTDALGARIAVALGPRTVSGEVQGGSSFLSQNDARVHVGLGDAGRYDGIDVRWPSGDREHFAGGAANQIVTITEVPARRGRLRRQPDRIRASRR